MAADKNDDPMEATLSSRVPRRTHQTFNAANSVAMLIEQSIGEEAQKKAKAEAREPETPRLRPPRHSELEGRLEVRPIGTALGLRELAALHKRTWRTLNVKEKRVLAAMAAGDPFWPVRGGTGQRATAAAAAWRVLGAMPG